MPKSSSERSSKSEFSDLDLYLGGLNLMVVLTWEMGWRERWGSGGDSNLGGGEGALGGGGEGEMGGDGDLVGGDCDVEGCGEGDLGGGDLCLFRQARRVLGEWMGNWYCRGTQTLWRGESGGWGSLPISPSKESSGREWRGNWYYRGTRTL